MLFSATVLLIQLLKKIPNEVDSEDYAPLDIIFLVSAIVLYIVLLPRAGFFVASFLLLLSALSIFDMPNIWRRLITAIFGTVISYVIFTLGLGVKMPDPTWFI